MKKILSVMCSLMIATLMANTGIAPSYADSYSYSQSKNEETKATQNENVGSNAKDDVFIPIHEVIGA